MPDTVLSSLCELSHMILTKARGVGTPNIPIFCVHIKIFLMPFHNKVCINEWIIIVQFRIRTRVEQERHLGNKI